MAHDRADQPWLDDGRRSSEPQGAEPGQVRAVTPAAQPFSLPEPRRRPLPGVPGEAAGNWISRLLKGRKRDTLAEYEEQVRGVGATLVAAAEKVEGPAVFLFCGIRPDHGTTTIASAVSRAIATSGARTVFATVEPDVDAPSHPLRALAESGGIVAFDDSRWLRLAVPSQFLELPEGARDPRTWVKAFDLLILDSPALTEFSTRYWVPRTDGVVLVVDGEQAGVGAVLQARDEIARLGGALTGVVLNRYRSRLPDSLR